MLEITSAQALETVRETIAAVRAKEAITVGRGGALLTAYVCQIRSPDTPDGPIVFGANAAESEDFLAAIEDLGRALDPTFQVPMGDAVGARWREALVAVVLEQLRRWLEDQGGFNGLLDLVLDLLK